MGSIHEAIVASDVVFVSFEGMEDRDWSSTAAQFHIAVALGTKKIVVYDPNRETRANVNSCGAKVHRSMVHLMGHGLCCYDPENILWISDKDKLLYKLEQLAGEDTPRTTSHGGVPGEGAAAGKE